MTTKRKLAVDMDEILDAIEAHGDDPEFFLNIETGEVAPWIDPMVSGEENPFDPDDEQMVAIPRREARDDYQAMEDFVQRVDEDDVRQVLGKALGGKGAFGRFREALAGYPDLRGRWEQEKHRQLLEEATAWLAELGIEPVYEPRPLQAPESDRRPVSSPQPAPSIGLVEMLLRGAPEGKTELLQGRVHRVFVAADRGGARGVFARLARELAEYHGLGWRRRFIEGTDRYSIERFELTVSDRVVDLSVAVPRSIWDAF